MLVRWTPFSEMNRLQSDLNRLFDVFEARPSSQHNEVQSS